MSYVRILFLVLIAALMLGAPPQTNSDLMPIEKIKGGAASPKSPHQTIRLDSQEVIIRLKRFSYTIDATFRFFNTGKTSTEWTGFPKWVVSDKGSTTDLDFIRFDGWVNGRQVKFTEERDASKIGEIHSAQNLPTLLIGTPRWLAHQVTFPSKERTTIRVTYEAPYNRVSSDKYEAVYFFGTGSLWKGNIGKAVFFVEGEGRVYFENGLSTRNLSENVKARPISISDNIVRYEITDFKPHPEAQIRVRPGSHKSDEPSVIE
jgi:hypothetical protein